MALVCPACGTENRSAARFCIECIAPLPTEFAPTQVAPAAAGAVEVEAGDGLPSILAAFVAARPGKAGGSAHRAPPPPAVQERRRGLWVSVAAFAIAMIIGAAGWLIAGAGGWYIYSTSTVEGAAGAGAVPEAPARTAAVGAVAAASAAQVSVPVAPRTTAAVPFTPQAATAEAAPEPPQPAVVAKPPRAEESRPTAVAARGAAASPPSQRCGELGFIARARCMAAQCEKPQFSRHAECAAVREQQRRMELKRNPQLVD